MLQAIRTPMRAAISGLERFDNPGLAFDRCIPALGDSEHSEAKDLLRKIRDSAASEAYIAAFDRWIGTAERQGVVLVRADLTGPLAVGLGNESSIEVGVTTNRIYGMPVIPGSAVKGLCHRTARLGLDMPADARRVLFGERERAASCTWHDAWFDPRSLNGAPFQVDTVTVHHPKYYQSHGEDGWPTDFDDPTPVAFLSVKPGARFMFGLQVHAAADVVGGWNELGRALLAWCLENCGIGGKTNAGYGRFKPAEMRGQANGSNGENSPPLPIWEGAYVSYRANDGSVEATREGDGTKAAAKLAGVEAADDVRELLKKKKALPSARVTVREYGNRWAVVRIERP